MNEVECKRMKKNTELLNKGILTQADDSSDDPYDESGVIVESTVNYWNDIDETYSSSSLSISTVDLDTKAAFRILKEKKKNIRQQESVVMKIGSSIG